MDPSKTIVTLENEIIIDFDQFQVTFISTGEIYELVEESNNEYIYQKDDYSDENKFTEEINNLIYKHYTTFLEHLADIHLSIEVNLLLNENVALREYDLDEFEYPFESFSDDIGDWTYFNIDNINDRGSFELKTSNIDLVWLFDPGEQDGEDWRMVAKTKDGYYFCFEASCDYTGFDCQGGGTVSWSRHPDKLWLAGLTESMRKRIQEQKDELLGTMTKPCRK